MLTTLAVYIMNRSRPSTDPCGMPNWMMDGAVTHLLSTLVQVRAKP